MPAYLLRTSQYPVPLLLVKRAREFQNAALVSEQEDIISSSGLPLLPEIPGFPRLTVRQSVNEGSKE